MSSPRVKVVMIKPRAKATMTKVERSIFLTIATRLVRKANIPATSARIPGMASHKLSENVLPPVSPLAATTMNTANSRINAIAKPTDHFPKRVFGITLGSYVSSERVTRIISKKASPVK